MVELQSRNLGIAIDSNETAPESRIHCRENDLTVVNLDEEPTTGSVSLQRNQEQDTADFDCSAIEKRSQNEWIVTDDIWKSSGGDLQVIVNCTEAGDSVLLDVTTPISPKTRTVIEWNLTIAPIVQKTGIIERSYFVLPESQISINCPEDSGLFLVRSSTVILANMEIAECHLSSDDSTGIIELAECDVQGGAASLQLQGVTIQHNTLRGASAVLAKSPECTSIEFKMVSFKNNTASSSLASLGNQNQLEYVELEENKKFQDLPDNNAPSIIHLPPSSNTTITNLTTRINTITIVYADNATVSFSRTSFYLTEHSVAVSVNNGSLAIFNDCSSNNNSAPNYGASISSFSSTVRIIDCNFRGNHAQTGGAVFALDSSTEITNSYFSTNSADYGGGAVKFLGGSITIKSTEFTRNKCESYGAAISLVDVTQASINNTICEDNLSSNYGGCMSTFRVQSLIISQSTFKANSAKKGGGMDIKDSYLELSDSDLNNNQASYGGGILLRDASEKRPASITNCTLIHNKATDRGGGMVANNLQNLNIRTSIFQNCTADQLGAGLYCLSSEAEIQYSDFTNNSRALGGGGIYSKDCILTLNDVNMTENKAEWSGGGAINQVGGSVSLERCVFRANNANLGGGFNCQEGQSTTIIKSEFLDNVASKNRGGGFTAQSCENIDVRDSIFIGNEAGTVGGGISIHYNSSMNASNIKIRRNKGVYRAGGICVFDSSKLKLFAGTISENSSGEGGGFAIRESIVEIRECSIESSTANIGGGILLYKEANVTIISSNISNNTADDHGGGIACKNAQFATEDVDFEGNRADISGGAFESFHSGNATLTRTTLQSNSATEGGAFMLRSDSICKFTDVSVVNNSASVFGGGGSLKQSDFHATKATFEGNRAQNGGALSVDGGQVHLNHFNLVSNWAEVAGGGILCTQSTVRVEASNMAGNTAMIRGGAVHCFRSANLSLSASVMIKGNMARSGGAVSVEDDSSIDLVGVELVDNIAQENGGALSVSSAVATITDSTFLNNSAVYGGGVHSQNSTSDFWNCTFADDTAESEGGAIAAAGNSRISVSESKIAGETSKIGGGISLSSSNLKGALVSITGCRSKDGGGIAADGKSTIDCRECTFENNEAGVHGGGVAVEATNNDSSRIFRFTESIFKNNSANLGGGLHVLTPYSVDFCEHKDCIVVELIGSIFIENHAAIAGGGIFGRDLPAIYFQCDHPTGADSLKHPSDNSLSTTATVESADDLCNTWTGNSAVVYGHTVASYARTTIVKIKHSQPGIVQNVQLDPEILDYKSGDTIPSIEVAVLDGLQQGPALGAGDKYVIAEFNSTQFTSKDTLSMTMNQLQKNFSNIVGYFTPGIFTITISFSESVLPPINIPIHVRDCIVNEISQSDGKLCLVCGETQYSIHPEETQCKQCPEDANCEADFIRPNDGYWHWSPCSVKMQQCLVGKACTRHNRLVNLSGITVGHRYCNFSPQTILEYQEMQCSKGYTGVLCGSCDKGYGRSSSFKCAKCRSQIFSICVLLLHAIVSFALTLFAVRSNVDDDNNISKELVRQHAFRLSEDGPSEPLIVEHQSTNTPDDRIGVESRQPDLILSEIYRKRTIGIFKILVDFFQVLALVLEINPGWKKYVKHILNFADVMGAVTSDVIVTSIDCALSGQSSSRRSIVCTIFKVAMPLTNLIILIAAWIIVRIRHKKPISYLKRRCLVTLISVSYLAYTPLTETAAAMLNCVTVYNSVEFDPEKSTSRWMTDTSVKCFTGNHIAMTVISICIFVFLSFGFPLAFAIAISMLKEGEGENSLLRQITGFLFEDYKESLPFWESMVMLKKAALVLVVVFGYNLGNNLQGILAVSVLMVALYALCVFQPYKSDIDELNRYQGASLLVCGLVFVAGLSSTDDQSSDTLVFALSLLIVLCIIGLTTFFVVGLMNSLTWYFRSRLREVGVEIKDDAPVLSVWKTYLALLGVLLLSKIEEVQSATGLLATDCPFLDTEDLDFFNWMT